jgi:hypothetical protein
MPVTLVLTDDQALDIASQVTGLLSQKRQTLAASRDAAHVTRAYHRKAKRFPRGPRLKLVEAYVSRLVPGAEFKSKEIVLSVKNGALTGNVVTYALAKLQKENSVKMLKRGTWKKL